MYDSAYKCFKSEECKSTSLIACLKVALYLAWNELAELNRRRMQKHTAASLKWRDSSFYYKKRCKELEERITEMEEKYGLRYNDKKEVVG